MIRLHAHPMAGLSAARPRVEHVRSALQQAIELEHSTIPPYLYALYSLDPERNAPAAAILRSVVIEEMLHMVLAANVLSALGGRPVIDRPDFIPEFPSRLPGGVEGQLTIHLSPLTRAQLLAFIEIEEPRERLDAVDLGDAVAGSCTIGEFYLAVADALGRLDPGDFAPAPHHQVGPGLIRGAVEVVDAASARQAIETIVEQGEGTGASVASPGSRPGEVAHYYRLMEIHEGRRLVAGDPPAYAGEAVGLDPAGVRDLPVDPRAGDYPAGSRAAGLNDAFNATYTALLASVHRLVNGRATDATCDEAFTLMAELGRRAREMTDPANGEPVGPTFEYRA